MSTTNPSYYQIKPGLEAVDVSQELYYNIGTAFSYMVRAGKKAYGGMNERESRVADLLKARKHLLFEIGRTLGDDLSNKGIESSLDHLGSLSDSIDAALTALAEGGSNEAR